MPENLVGLKYMGTTGPWNQIVSEIPKNRSGVTRADVLERVRQKLWQSGIKPERPHYKTHFWRLILLFFRAAPLLLWRYRSR
jgi:hypothetical protein